MAFYDVIVTTQAREVVQTAFDAANASADLVVRQHAAGNATDLALAREQEQRERARIEIGRAAQRVKERRTRLGARLGIASDQAAWTTAGPLADPVPTMPSLDNLAQAAAGSSLELEALRADADAAAARHHYAMVRTILPELGAGIAVVRGDAAAQARARRDRAAVQRDEREHVRAPDWRGATWSRSVASTSKRCAGSGARWRRPRRCVAVVTRCLQRRKPHEPIST
jgi:hypothetical protein